MAGEIYQFTIVGLDALKRNLLALTPTVRRKVAYKALRKAAVPIAETASAPGVVPVLLNPIYRRNKLIRKPGTLRDAIKIRSSKDATRAGDVGVFVNVRPAKGSDRGKYSPNDPFYWRFVEFGTRYMRARPFLRAGAVHLQDRSQRILEAELAIGFQQLNLPGL